MTIEKDEQQLLEDKCRAKIFGVKMAIRSMSVQILAAKSEEQERRYTDTMRLLEDQYCDIWVEVCELIGLTKLRAIGGDYLYATRLSAEMTKEAYGTVTGENLRLPISMSDDGSLVLNKRWPITGLGEEFPVHD